MELYLPMVRQEPESLMSSEVPDYLIFMSTGHKVGQPSRLNFRDISYQYCIQLCNSIRWEGIPFQITTNTVFIRLKDGFLQLSRMTTNR